MSPAPKPSPSVIAAAVAAILFGLAILLITSSGFFGVMLYTLPKTSPELPPFARAAGLSVMAFMMCLSAFGIATGIGLIFLRNWARISLLIWAGFSLFFGIIGIPIAFFLPFASPPNTPDLPAESLLWVRWILLFVYGLPLLFGVWWLILFNRRTVKAQFARAADSADSGLLQKPRRPLPLTVLAWFFISTAANIVILPLLPFSVPVILFGHLIPGAGGTVLLILNTALLVAAGVGILKLKPWSYPLTIGFQIFWSVSSVASMLNPNYESLVSSFLSDINKAMNLPPNIYSSANYLHQLRWAQYFGLLVPVGIVVLLYCYRRRFREVASGDASVSGHPA